MFWYWWFSVVYIRITELRFSCNKNEQGLIHYDLKIQLTYHPNSDVIIGKANRPKSTKFVYLLELFFPLNVLPEILSVLQVEPWQDPENLKQQLY
jgi:hypothetical protein